MNEEVWKDIPRFEGCYQVSNYGRIKSLARFDYSTRFLKERIKRPCYDKDGYLIISLGCAKKNIKPKTYKIHQLVAKAFIPNPNDLPEINHIDEDKTNNRADNLEWCTTKYNLTYGHRLDCARGERNSKHKLTEKQVLEIRRIYKKGDLEYGQNALAKKYGVSHPSIASIVKNETWKHLLQGGDTNDS